MYPGGLRHIRPDRRINEWKVPGRRVIKAAASNDKQVAIALQGGEVTLFELELGTGGRLGGGGGPVGRGFAGGWAGDWSGGRMGAGAVGRGPAAWAERGALGRVACAIPAGMLR